MKNDYQKYLETQSKNLDDWENIANQSLKEKTIDNPTYPIYKFGG